MSDWNALIDTHTQIKKLARNLNDATEEARAMDLTIGSSSVASKRLTKAQQAVLNKIIDPEQISVGRSLLSHALNEKSPPVFVNECLVRETFSRCTYNAGRARALLVVDIIEILEEFSPPCCLAVYRASLEIGLSERFVPPAAAIASKVRDQESHFHSMLGQISFLERFRETVLSM